MFLFPSSSTQPTLASTSVFPSASASLQMPAKPVWGIQETCKHWGKGFGMGEKDIIQCNYKVKVSALKSKVVNVAPPAKASKRLQTRSKETWRTGICIAATEGRGSLPLLLTSCSPKQHNTDLVFLWLCSSSHGRTKQKASNTQRFVTHESCSCSAHSRAGWPHSSPARVTS